MDVSVPDVATSAKKQLLNSCLKTHKSAVTSGHAGTSPAFSHMTAFSRVSHKWWHARAGWTPPDPRMDKEKEYICELHRTMTLGLLCSHPGALAKTQGLRVRRRWEQSGNQCTGSQGPHYEQCMLGRWKANGSENVGHTHARIDTHTHTHILEKTVW